MPRAWAVTQKQPQPEKGEDPVTVLVTGFGPFLQKLPRNSSWEIASTLPALLPSVPDSPTPTHISVHHTAIRVAYNTITSLVPTLIPPNAIQRPEPDVVLHIGLAAGRDFYTLEKGAHGRGYGAIPDVDGQRFPDSLADERFPSSQFPPILSTSFDTDDVLKRWRGYLSHPPQSTSSSTNPSTAIDASKETNNSPHPKIPDVRLSPDAGNFMCGFIYYNSLAGYYDPTHISSLASSSHSTTSTATAVSVNETTPTTTPPKTQTAKPRKGHRRPVAFLHVPDLTHSPEALDEGRRVAIALIKALVESLRVRGLVEEDICDRDGGRGVGREVEVAGTDVNFA